MIKGFSDYIPIHKIPNVLEEEDKSLVIGEIVNDKDFEKSVTEMETNESMEELKNPQDVEDGCIIILNYLNEKEMVDPRVKRC